MIIWRADWIWSQEVEAASNTLQKIFESLWEQTDGDLTINQTQSPPHQFVTASKTKRSPYQAVKPPNFLHVSNRITSNQKTSVRCNKTLTPPLSPSHETYHKPSAPFPLALHGLHLTAPDVICSTTAAPHFPAVRWITNQALPPSLAERFVSAAENSSSSCINLLQKNLTDFTSLPGCRESQTKRSHGPETAADSCKHPHTVPAPQLNTNTHKTQDPPSQACYVQMLWTLNQALPHSWSLLVTWT